MIRGRLLFAQIEKHVPKKQFTIITGARQTGKTSLLNLLHQSLHSKGLAVFQYTLEDSALLSMLNDNPENLFSLTGTPKKLIANKQINPEDKIYVLIDEIQYLKDPSNFLKLLYDKYHESLKLIVTGSSAFYIDRKFTDSLAGRKQIFWLKTLSFNEFLQFKECNELEKELQQLREPKVYYSSHDAVIKSFFDEYLTYGGYPAVVLANDIIEKKQILNDIKNSYLKRDIHESNISHEIQFMHLFRLLAQQTGELVNRNELSATLRLDNKTIENYLYILQKCFHIHLLNPLWNNLRKEITKMPKVYFYDLGMRNSLLNRFDMVSERSDKGQLIENYLFCRLNELYSADQLNFWRTTDQHEVDFVVSTEFQKGYAYEVKYDGIKADISKYKKFIQAYPDYPLSFISFLKAENCIEALKF